MKSKWNQMWMLCQCVIFLGIITSVKLDKICEKPDNCQVETNQNGTEPCTFLCQNGGIEVKLFPTKVIISCKNYDESDYLKWIKNLNNNSIAENIDEVKIQQCPVFNGSYSEIFKAFNTKTIKKFTLSIGKHNDSHPIIFEPRHFTNLSSLTDLQIVNNDITVILQEQLFKNMTNLEDLSLYNNNLQNLTGKIFDPLKKLKYLDLNNANLTRLDENIFHPLSNLTVLKMENNGLDNLSRTLFSSLNQLKDLELGGNSMTILSGGIFDNLKNLVNLTLGDNNLTGIPPKLFSNNSNLERIKLNNAFNKDNFTLPPGFLTNLKSLKILNLKGNGLTSLPEGLFNDTINLQELYIDRNNLSSLAMDQFKRLNNLMILDLSFNDLKILTTQDFSNFNTSMNRTINLSDNQFNITKINLSHNKLENIEDIASLKALEVLELDNNQLKYLSSQTIDLLRSNKNLKSITLHGNPWVCNCNTKYLLNFIKNPGNNIKIPNDRNITCDKSGDSIMNLTEDELCSPSPSSSSRTTLYILIVLTLLGAVAIWYYKGEIRMYILRSPRLRWLAMKCKKKVDQEGTYNAFFDQGQSQENLNFVGSGGRERQPLIEL